MGKPIYKTAQDLEKMRKSADLLGRTHAEIAKRIMPGITTNELDKIAYEFIKDNGAKPSFLGLYDCPSSILTSVNNQVVHGLPNNRPLRNGDIISVDCGVFLDGFHSDSAYTYEIGNVAPEIRNLLKVTKEALYIGIENMKYGNRIGDISNAIQKHVEKNNYTVVRELVGHGVGRKMHEAPEVPNFGKAGKGEKIRNGLVIAIEPMVNMGSRSVLQSDDGWSIVTKDGKPAAHFEHTVALVDGKPEILTTFKYIEQAIKMFHN
ncbi:type I methionyl aminopeptidase [Bernardetia sp.]|uniref:type I methionyl aminopeptidase n=1 Tax=Bernardetia sp. TaxID=1937974 RepID=UPI0025BDE262|nr:type I methionyl aminopeptidase [Bernardetia sp.]